MKLLKVPGNWKTPSDAEAYRACMDNAMEAAKRAGEAMRQLGSFRIDHAATGEAARKVKEQHAYWYRELAKAIADQPHWRGLARWWANRMAEADNEATEEREPEWAA